MKFYRCNICNNIVMYIEKNSDALRCCGQPLNEIVPGTVEASHEKHIPIVSIIGNKVVVTIGSIEHPMADNHYIEWVVLETKQGSQMKNLLPGMKPFVEFIICEDDEVINVYAYCNLHGLWQK